MYRFLNTLKSDITFQLRQGFYAIYVLVTLVYMVVMMKLPESIKAVAVSLTVFSDPSVLGFFFIGGLVMLEKDQGMFRYLTVTPLSPGEYLLSKAFSMALVAMMAGSTITLTTYSGHVNWFYLIPGILLTSLFFTLYGILPAAKSRTINQYFIRMVPYLLFMILPCFSAIGFPYDYLFNIFPSVAGLRLIMGAFTGLAPLEALLNLFILAVMNALILKNVIKTYAHMATAEEA
jgi:fluoroquinolone transport system permease protein